MIPIALEIVGYWIGLAVFMWAIMYTALTLARACEFVADRWLR